MKEPVDHIGRPRLPWRDASEPSITECGYDASKVKTITRNEFFQRRKELGQQRTAMLTCMTCSQTAERWEPWETDPRKALEREIAWECAWRSDRGQRLKDELLAVAALIEAHPEEFRELIGGLEQKRAWLEKKAKPKERPAPRTVTWHQT
jgi:hypothetical protein